MPLDKSDAPQNDQATAKPAAKPVTDAQAEGAVQAAIDAGAGVPDAQQAAAEALPEKDDVQSAIKEGMLATDAQTEAEAKAKVVDLSPDAAETPSGFALKKTAGIADDVKRGEEYARVKGAMRHGYVPADDADLK